METTTVKISKDTKARLDKLKEYKEESYEAVVKKILWILNLCKTNPESAGASLKKIEVLRARRRKFEVVAGEDKLEKKDLETKMQEKEVLRAQRQNLNKAKNLPIKENVKKS